MGCPDLLSRIGTYAVLRNAATRSHRQTVEEKIYIAYLAKVPRPASSHYLRYLKPVCSQPSGASTQPQLSSATALWHMASCSFLAAPLVNGHIPFRASPGRLTSQEEMEKGPPQYAPLAGQSSFEWGLQPRGTVPICRSRPRLCRDQNAPSFSFEKAEREFLLVQQRSIAERQLFVQIP